MSDMHIERAHRLGLPKAREIATRWVRDIERRFDMTCTVTRGEAGDRIDFTRPGASGRLLVTADRFDLTAKLGFLLGAFSRSIEAEIETNLDALLDAKAAPRLKKG